MVLERSRYQPGYGVELGCYYACLRDRTEVIHPWGPEAGAWTFHSLSGWKPFAPNLHIRQLESLVQQHPASALKRSEARAGRFLLRSLPNSAKDCVRPFCQGHWPLLQLINRGGERAVELIESNPALAFLLALRRQASEVESGGADATSLVSLLGKRRREIAGACGFSPNEATVRLMAKIRRSTVSGQLLDSFRVLSEQDHEGLEMLRHLPSINSGVLEVVSSERLRSGVAFSFLRRVSMIGDDMRSTALVRRLTDFNGVRGPRPKQFRSFADLDRNLGLFSAAPPRARRPKTALVGPNPFPPPPIEPTGDIRPIQSPKELRAEGREMQHCAGTYVRSVTIGVVYFYRMDAPERATICLRRGPGGWRLDQVRGPKNASVSQSTRKLIRRWLLREPNDPADGRIVTQPRPKESRRPGACPEQLSFDFQASPVCKGSERLVS